MTEEKIAENSEQIIPTLIEEEMKQSYVDYAMSVIIGRALPDVRDGLKPVHRRILFAMNEMGLSFNKPFRKSARIVGEVLGKFHPHGDSAVYDALVRMAQDFSLRYPLVNGQGNFGSVDGDRAAAMRYTEAKLMKISSELLTDIEKDTVNFVDNFDGSMKEPTVLPSKIPNLLVNGSTGIAVGMATNIPPHNLNEVAEAVKQVIDEPELTDKEVMELVPGPDFPTGGTILGKSGIRSAYATGHGKVKIRSKTHIEENKRLTIIVDEIPYMVNKSMLIEEIASNVRNKNIPGIHDIRDESDRSGMRVVIELKKDANKDVVLNQLFKHTRMQTSQGINLLALTNNQPKVMTLKEIIVDFIAHRKEVVIRRTEFDLKKSEEKAHLLEGLIIALDDIDTAVQLIKKSSSAIAAKEALMDHFKLSEVQSQAILDMKLQKLTSLETEKIREDHKKLLELISELKSILESDEKIMNLIKDELTEIQNQYADERKTEILDIEDDDFDIEDLIEEEDVVVTISHSGYIKRTPLALYKAQRRGGKGIIATTTKEEDIVEHLFIANTHDFILFFTDNGKVHWLKVYRIPESGRYSAGKAIVNLLELPKDVNISSYIKVREFDDKHYLFMGTRNGVVKKTNLKAYSRPRAGGIIAINLDEGDELINVVKTDGEQRIMLCTKLGMAVKFKEIDVRPMGRASRGVKGVNLKKNDEVVAMIKANDEHTILTVTENGYGKRTLISDYRLINRGGVGVRNIICSERNGKVAAVKSVTDEDQILLISRSGIIIRTPTKEISTIGRNTQGLRIMRLNTGDIVVAAAKIVIGDDEQNEDEPLDPIDPPKDSKIDASETKVLNGDLPGKNVEGNSQPEPSKSENKEEEHDDDKTESVHEDKNLPEKEESTAIIEESKYLVPEEKSLVEEETAITKEKHDIVMENKAITEKEQSAIQKPSAPMEKGEDKKMSGVSDNKETSTEEESEPEKTEPTTKDTEDKTESSKQRKDFDPDEDYI